MEEENEDTPEALAEIDEYLDVCDAFGNIPSPQSDD